MVLHSLIIHGKKFRQKIIYVKNIGYFLLFNLQYTQQLIEVISEELKYGITTGIGLFIAPIEMRLTVIIVSHPSNLVVLGIFIHLVYFLFCLV